MLLPPVSIVRQRVQHHFDEQSVLPDVVEPPVPGGLPNCTEAYGTVLEFFGLDPLILVAASEGAPTASEKQTHEYQFAAWVDGLSDVESKQLLRKFLGKNATAIKAETIAVIRQSGNSSAWPTASLGRSFQELLDKTETLRTEYDAREQQKREAAANRAAAEILADHREAVGGDEGEKITRKYTAHLAKKHPTLNRLKSLLRKRGLLE